MAVIKNISVLTYRIKKKCNSLLAHFLFVFLSEFDFYIKAFGNKVNSIRTGVRGCLELAVRLKLRFHVDYLIIALSLRTAKQGIFTLAFVTCVGILCYECIDQAY